MKTNFVLIVFLAVLTVVTVKVGKPIFQEEMANHKAEGECIGTLISQGVERSDIAAFNGECWIK